MSNDIAPETKGASDLGFAIDDLMRAFEAFKETNDQRLDEIERRASADTLTSEKLDRINRALDDNKRIVDELALKSARPSLGGAPVRSGAALQHKAAFGPITLGAARTRPLRTSIEAYADIRRRLGINLTVDLIDKLGQDIVLLIQAAGGLIGTIMTILGRMRATTLLERRPVKLKL
jgi:hypothetical protein